MFGGGRDHRRRIEDGKQTELVSAIDGAYAGDTAGAADGVLRRVLTYWKDESKKQNRAFG